MSDSLASLLASPVVGCFAADSALVARIDAFAVDSSNSVADRAAALRFLGASVFGFDGADAGVDVPDSEFVASYLVSR